MNENCIDGHDYCFDCCCHGGCIECGRISPDFEGCAIDGIEVD